MVKDKQVQPKQDIITSGILSHTLLKFIVICLPFAQQFLGITSIAIKL